MELVSFVKGVKNLEKLKHTLLMLRMVDSSSYVSHEKIRINSVFGGCIDDL